VCAGILAPRELKLIGPNPAFGLLRALFFSGEDPVLVLGVVQEGLFPADALDLVAQLQRAVVLVQRELFQLRPE